MSDQNGPYLGSGISKKTQKLMRAARRVNLDRDKLDREFGAATPEEGGPLIHVRTVLSALICGLDREDWSCVAEATAMLQEMELILRAPMVKTEASS